MQSGHTCGLGLIRECPQPGSRGHLEDLFFFFLAPDIFFWNKDMGPLSSDA